MTRALVFSDSHGRIEGVLEVIKRHKDIDIIFHAGDIEGDEDLLRNATAKQVCIVRGNCDWTNKLPEHMIVDVEDIKVAITHGHRYVNYGTTDTLKYWAMENNAQLVIFGHTHVPYFDASGKVVALNPGSISKPRQEGHQETYAYMEIDGEEMKIEIRRAKDDKKFI